MPLHIDAGPQVAEYFSSLPDTQRVQVDALADRLQANGTPAFREADPTQLTCVAADVARARHLPETLRTIETLAERTSNPPLVAVSANFTDGKYLDRDRVAQNLAMLHSFRNAHPELPFSSFMTTNEPGMSIGSIYDLVFGAGIRAYQQRREERHRPVLDILTTRMDADTLGATPTYFAQLQEKYAASTEDIWIGFPSVRHDRLDPQRFPLANRLLVWYDLAQVVGESFGPAHFSINLKSFARGKGFGDASFGEQNKLADRIAATMDDNTHFELGYLRHVKAICSNSRLVSQMAQGQIIDYGELRATSPQPNEAQPQLTRDVPVEYFNHQVEALMSYVPELALDQRRNKLLLDLDRQLRESGTELTPETELSPADVADIEIRAVRHGIMVMKCAAKFVIGEPHGTRESMAKIEAIAEEVIDRLRHGQDSIMREISGD